MHLLSSLWLWHSFPKLLIVLALLILQCNSYNNEIISCLTYWTFSTTVLLSCSWDEQLSGCLWWCWFLVSPMKTKKKKQVNFTKCNTNIAKFLKESGWDIQSNAIFTLNDILYFSKAVYSNNINNKKLLNNINLRHSLAFA